MAGSRPEQLMHDLQRALRHLYDPGELRRNPLVELLGIDPREDAPSIMRRTLTDAIKSLNPGSKVPRDSTAMRIYQVLTYRYIEQSSQKEVAADLAISTRQLRRLETTANRALAELLLLQSSVRTGRQEVPGPPLKGLAQTQNDSGEPFSAVADREKELDWLQESSPNQTVDVVQLVEAVLSTISPLLKLLEVQIKATINEEPPPITAKAIVIREALVNVLTAAARSVPGGLVTVVIDTIADRILIDVTSHNGKRNTGEQDSAEDLILTQRIVQLSSGTIEVLPTQAEQVSAVRLSLPLIEQVPVLVIDDHEDILRLFERYLTGSLYQFVGAPDPETALTLAEKQSPRIILLDVMLPGIDGWELLGRLRTHPKLTNVPIIICSILHQEQLALALGAAELIRKPISRDELLAALNRNLHGRGTESS